MDPNVSGAIRRRVYERARDYLGKEFTIKD
jgi:hypothetical protein